MVIACSDVVPDALLYRSDTGCFNGPLEESPTLEELTACCLNMGTILK